MKRAIAFAPGHISGFFQPVTDAKNFNKIGSRGAGVSISHGATAQVEITKERKQEINITVNHQSGFYPVTHEALNFLLDKEQLKIKVAISLDLPVSHGFGMSAASALSSSLALAELLNKSSQEAIQAAHRAEVMYHTGLGDVCCSAIGGFEIRETPGILPYARIQKLSKKRSILLGIFPGIMSTELILTDNTEIKHISHIGSYCTNEVIKSPTIESIMNYSYYFTKKCRFAPKYILEILKEINNRQLASMCMLGHSIFVVGNNQNIKSLLSEKASVIESSVDNTGARIVKTYL